MKFSLGKDFWKVLNLVELIIHVIRELSKKLNADTPEGEV